jgi:hypothetical protein
MRSQQGSKNTMGAALKSTPKLKLSPMVRPPIKKIYCTKCQKLVKGTMHGSGKTTQVKCPKCAQNLWGWNVTAWRCGGDGT